jgi:DNA-binding transcriptional LysR family regulator
LELSQRQIEVFRAVMLSRSVTKAAEELRSSQPTTSRILADLERAVGFKLFVRDRKRMVPTHDGMALFEEVQLHFVGLDRIARAATRIEQFDNRILRIATIPSVSFGLLPLAVAPFRRQFPAARIAIEVHTYESVVHNVMASQCDIGFTAYRPARSGVHVEHILTAEAVCIVPSKSPLAAKEQINARDLADMPFVSLESKAPSRERIDALFARSKVSRQLVLETQNGGVICALVKCGAGIAVIDPLSAYSFHDPDLAVRQFRPRIDFEFYALWRSDTPLSRFASAFLDQVQEGARLPFRHVR